jgi:serine O-acetyltransferase
MIHTKCQLKYFIYTDEIRNFGMRPSLFFKLRNNRYKLLYLLRICNYLANKKDISLMLKILRLITFSLYRRTQNKLGVEINPLMKIGKGFFLPHPNGIILHPLVSLGDNVTILQQVTIGNNIRKGMNNLAVIGNNVSIGAGAKIIGPCKIGNNVIVGANAVVTKDIKDDSVVAGIPARYINSDVPVAHNSNYKSEKEFLCH